MKTILLILLLAVTCACFSQQRFTTKIGKLSVVDLSRLEDSVKNRIIDQPDANIRRALIVDQIYKPYKGFWAGFVGDTASFYKIYVQNVLQTKSETVNSKIFIKLLMSTVQNYTNKFRHTPEGTWYILYGPSWTDMGGIGDGIMLVDLNHPLNRDPSHLGFYLPHELNHQVYDYTNPSSIDPNGNTALYRIIDEGFACYINHLYWGKTHTDGEVLGYSESEFEWCENHKDSIFKAVKTLLFATDRSSINLLVSRNKKLLAEGPSAIGYYVGYKMCNGICN